MAYSLGRSKSLKLGPSPSDNFSKPLSNDRLEVPGQPQAVQWSDASDSTTFNRTSPQAGLYINRPSTSGGLAYRRQGEKCPQLTIVSSKEMVQQGHSPTSPSFFFAAEVRTSRPLPSPRSPGKAITTDFADPHSTSWPLESTSHSTPAPCPRVDQTPVSAERVQKPRLGRWRSIRGMFGRKNAQDASLAFPTPAFKGSKEFTRQSFEPESIPAASRLVTPSRWDSRSTVHTSPQFSPSNGQQAPNVQTYVPTHGNNQGRGVYRPSHATPTNKSQSRFGPCGDDTAPAKPIIDIDIPDVHMERYSVMFAGLIQTKDELSLLSRRQSRAKRPELLIDDSLKPAPILLSDEKQCPSTPRSAAKYQLSLFPQPSPRSQLLNPLGMHRPRVLQRAQTSPLLSGINTGEPGHQSSNLSRLDSEETLLHLDVGSSTAVQPDYVAPPQIHIFQTLDEDEQSEVSRALTPTSCFSAYSDQEQESNFASPLDWAGRAGGWSTTATAVEHNVATGQTFKKPLTPILITPRASETGHQTKLSHVVQLEEIEQLRAY